MVKFVEGGLGPLILKQAFYALFKVGRPKRLSNLFSCCPKDSLCKTCMVSLKRELLKGPYIYRGVSRTCILR